MKPTLEALKRNETITNESLIKTLETAIAEHSELVDSISEEQTARKELEQRLSTETARAESFRAKVAELTATTNATNEIEKIIKDKLTGMVTLMLSQTPTTLQTKIDEITSTPVQNLKALMEQTESQFDTWKSAKNGEQSMGENMPLAAIKDFHSKR